MQLHLTSKSRFVALLVMLVLGPTLAAACGAPASEKPETNDKLKQLLQQRLVVVTQVHKVTVAAYKNGETSFERVLDARASMLRAKLDVSETKPDRVKVHEEMVKTAEELWEVVKQHAAGGAASHIDVLKAEAQLLEAQIGLERERISK